MGAVVKTWTVVPVKGFDAAKSRLATCLCPADRSGLARAMFQHVVGVLTSTPRVEGILVVTDSTETGRIAATFGAEVMFDRRTATLASHVDDALSEVARGGAERALVVMSDLPELTQDDVENLLVHLDHADMVIAPDTSGEHTNALGVRLNIRRATSFGDAQSFRMHVETAVAAGLRVARVVTRGLAFDVDTPDDYARLVGSRRRAG